MLTLQAVLKPWAVTPTAAHHAEPSVTAMTAGATTPSAPIHADITPDIEF